MTLGAVVTILVALTFDFTNGFHDAANSIATVVSTRVLSPRYAVMWAAFFTFVAFLVFGLVFNIGLGVLARLMPAMQVYFVGVPLSIMIGFLIFGLVLSAMMGTYLNYVIGVMHELTPLK